MDINELKEKLQVGVTIYTLSQGYLSDYILFDIVTKDGEVYYSFNNVNVDKPGWEWKKRIDHILKDFNNNRMSFDINYLKTFRDIYIHSRLKTVSMNYGDKISMYVPIDMRKFVALLKNDKPRISE